MISVRKKSADLYHLIRSLTQPEKRHFKLYASIYNSDNNKTLLLYDLVSKQKSYDESHILKKMTFADAKQLPNLKNRLYKIILDSLEAFHSNNDYELELRKYLNQIHILNKKGLYNQCIQVINKAKKACAYYKDDFHILRVLEWERKIISNSGYANHSVEEVQTLLNEIADKVKQYEILCKSIKASTEIAAILKKDFTAREQTKQDRITAALNNLTAEEIKDASYYAKMHLFNAKGLYYSAIKDSKNSRKNQKDYLKHIESNELITVADIEAYTIALNNYMFSCPQGEKYDERLSCVEKLKELAQHSMVKKNRQIRCKILTRYYNGFIATHTENKDYLKAKTLIPDIAILLEEYNDTVEKDYIIILSFNISYVFFYLQDYKQAKFWINKVINSDDANLRGDLHCFARMFNCIIYYELNDYETLPYIIKNTYRFLLKRKSVYKTEQVFIDFFRSITKLQNQDALTSIFESTKNKLVEITKDPNERVALDYFDFISWLDRKIKS